MMRLLFLARALQNREVGRRPKESETHIEIEEGDGNDKWYWNVLSCWNHNHILWSFTYCLEFLESPQENTEQESWTGWAWNLVPSLPAWTEDWTEDDNENRGFTFQSGIYIDDLAFNLRVMLHFHFPVQCHWSLQCVLSSLYFQVLFVSFSSFFFPNSLTKLSVMSRLVRPGQMRKIHGRIKLSPSLHSPYEDVYLTTYVMIMFGWIANLEFAVFNLNLLGPVAVEWQSQLQIRWLITYLFKGFVFH